MNPVLKYFIHVGDATSQWVNTAFLFGDPNESISGRAYRMRDKVQWWVAKNVIDFILSPFEANHCEKAYRADVSRAARLISSQRA